MIDQVLDAFLGQLSGVHHDLVVYRQGGCCSGVLIGNHVEVEDAIITRSNHLIVNHCALTRVENVSVLSLEKSGGDSLVDENEKESGVVTFLEGLDRFSKLTVRTFKSEAMFLHSRPTDTISEDDDLLRN